MFLIRKVQDATNPSNRAAIAEAQRIMRPQFPGMEQAGIDRLPDLLRDPIKYRFVDRLFVAEGLARKVPGVGLLLHAPDGCAHSAPTCAASSNGWCGDAPCRDRHQRRRCGAAAPTVPTIPSGMPS